MKKRYSTIVACSFLFTFSNSLFSHPAPVGKGGGAENSSNCRCEKPVMLCNGRYAGNFYKCGSCIEAENAQARLQSLQEKARRNPK